MLRKSEKYKSRKYHTFFTVFTRMEHFIHVLTDCLQKTLVDLVWTFALRLVFAAETRNRLSVCRLY